VTEVLPREGAEAVARGIVGRERLFVGVARVGGDLLCHRPYLALDRGAVGGVAKERVDPALGTVPVGDVMVEQELAEQDAGADVGEGPEGENPMRRLHAGRECGIVTHDAVDDAADGLVDQRDPELFEIRHDRIIAVSDRPYPWPVAATSDLLLERLASAPDEAGLFLDFDGVLAPIVDRPEDAAPPRETRAELERLVGRYALVAVVSGRESEDVRARLGVKGVVCVGSHGLELEPQADRWRRVLAAFAADAPWPQHDIEVKGLAVAFHFRDRADEREAVRVLDVVAESAREEGLVARYGRKVLEVLPPVGSHKGTAVRSLIDERGLRRALAAGDDTTDIDSFAALDVLEVAVRVAVTSAEAPRALLDAADLVVESTDEFLALLRRL
jgi:trehalose 6-phosphate phosphatase